MVVEWARAEDALLGMGVQLEQLAVGTLIVSPAGNRRFNSLRVLEPSAWSREEWTRELARLRELFHGREMPLTLQMADPLTPEDAIPGEWEVVGPLFLHVATDVADFEAVKAPDIEPEVVASDEDIDAFTDLVVDTRIPVFARESERPLVRKIVDEHRSRCYLLRVDDEVVAQFAIFPAGDSGYGLNFVTVAEDHRGRGLMKSIYRALPGVCAGRLYGQIIDGVQTMAFRQRFPSTELLAQTRTYQPPDDPYKGK